MNIKILTRTLGLLVMCGLLLGTAAAQEASLYSASADAALVSKYIWRGQRLTNDWSLQPAVALNAWGNMDLTAVNDFNPGDPRSGSGDGLKGKFTEIDYTVSYDYSFDTVSVGAGTIFYTFPERFASTTEIYGSISLDTLPLAPSATIYIDVDETSASGDTGAYFLFGAGHSIALNHDIFSSLDLSGSLGFANAGFTDFYYGVDEAGAHDASITASLPININDNWSAGVWVTYSGLMGSEKRAAQFQDPREPVRPTGATYADTVWGGFSLNLSF
jgi:hypothetical protein